jgi:hypothetical protein
MARPEYEIYLRGKTEHTTDDPHDFETVDYDPCINYRDAVKKAKQYSQSVPFKNHFGQLIEQIQIAKYINDEENFGTTYYLIWKETYENGKCVDRDYCG